ncbi:GTPase [Thermodesulfobacteriota bacterium]
MKSLPERIGLTFDARLAEHKDLERRRWETDRLLAALSWKSQLDESFPIIVAIVGGTGTGKSTLFNSFVGKEISKVGTRRPCTLNAVAWIPAPWREQFSRCSLFNGPAAGEENDSCGPMTIVGHQDGAMTGLILVDTPDFDSVEVSNRRVAEDCFIVSDAMIFVTSQEKYGDLSGREVREQASRWGKTSLFVMNKVVSQSAFDDFRNSLEPAGQENTKIVPVERVDSLPHLIPGLRERPEFAVIFNMGPDSDQGQALRREELARLQEQAAHRLEALEEGLEAAVSRVASTAERIEALLGPIEERMETELDAIVSPELEGHIKQRLSRLLAKYDVFFVPRMFVRRTIQRAFGLVGDMLFSQGSGTEAGDPEKQTRAEDLLATRSTVRLKPLESAVARLNKEVARLISQDDSLEDLRKVATNDVPQWDDREVKAQFDKAFPGVERLLEAEFDSFRSGLSGKDQLTLYGSYTLWALLLITAEVVLGGGFTILDALLGTAIVPLIPKWLLGFKVVDLLKEIGRKIDQQYRVALKGILRDQGELYLREFRGLLPDEEAMARVRRLRRSLR